MQLIEIRQKLLWKAGYLERGTSGLEGGLYKPATER